MTTWIQYPHAEGFWRMEGTIRLTAWPNGSWTATDTTGKQEPRNSDMAPVTHPKHGLQEAKQAAEEAAKLMSNG